MHGLPAALSLLTLVLGAAAVSDSTSLVQKALEVASPRGRQDLSESLKADQNQFVMELEAKVGQGIRRMLSRDVKSMAETEGEMNTELQMKYSVHRLLQKTRVPAFVERLLSVFFGEALTLVRNRLGEKEQEVLDGIASLELDKRNFLNSETVGEVFGEVAAIFDSSGFSEITKVLLDLRDTVPPAMLVTPKVPMFAKQLWSNTRQAAGRLGKEALEDAQGLGKDVSQKLLKTGKTFLSNATDLGKRTAQQIKQLSTESLKSATDKYGPTEFANLRRQLDLARKL